jgi:hypothetical protein
LSIIIYLLMIDSRMTYDDATKYGFAQQQGGDSEDAEEFRGLADVVARAATADDRTVIITCVNHAWAAPGSLLDLFLESFRIGDGIAHLLSHVLIVAMDPPAMERCRALHPHCYLYTMPGVDFASAKFFLSKEYLELVWSKLKLQRRVLQLGYNFLFTVSSILLLPCSPSLASTNHSIYKSSVTADLL